MNELTDLAEEYTRQWASESSPDLDAFLAGASSIDTVHLGRLARIDQAQRWQRGDCRLAEEYLDRYPALQADDDSAVDLIYHEYLLREKLAEQPSLEKFTNRFPKYAAAITEQVSLHRVLADTSENLSNNASASTEVCPLPYFGNSLLPKLPAQFGRYRVVQLLGRGGMGAVYFAEDTELGRQVALKFPRFDQDVSPEVVERFRREARIAATFHHPNLCPVYDFGELDGTLFLTMPCMTGEPLSARIQAGPLPEKEAVQIALKVARAMSVAHRSGVIHRDLKPANILLRGDGEPVVMDFGLARRGLDLDPRLTGSGALLGTLAYMPPERVSSCRHEASPVSDVYSLGVILYEMLTGRPPFEGSWPEVWEQVKSQLPAAPSMHAGALSPDLDQICLKTMAKEPRARFASMDALADALARVGEQDPTAVIDRGKAKSSRTWPRRLAIGAVAAASVIVALGGFAWHAAGLRWARQQVPVIEQLVNVGRSFDAYQLAVRVRRYLTHDPTITGLMPSISDRLSVESDPAGARVYLKRFVAGASNASPRAFVGTTPLVRLAIARGSYVVNIEKEGYDPFQRSWSGVVDGGLEAPIVLESTPIQVTLTPLAKVKPGMVVVPGGQYELAAWARPTHATVKLDDYFIDKYEVANLEYRDFVIAGGYQNKQFWTQPFIKEGVTLVWDDAMRMFTDKTGVAAPRDWSNGDYPEGKADHPVTGISCYEAAAYAAFRGKSLPTIFQWEKAARDGANYPFGLTMPWGLLGQTDDGRANFAPRGTLAVGSLEFGVSPFGCYDMAGNASEWCLNETSEGLFITSGGSWGCQANVFGSYGPYPGFHRSDRVGFRCVWNPSATGDQGGMRINVEDEVPRYTPKPEELVRPWLTRYDYDKDVPLNERVEKTPTDEWTREKIEYTGADSNRVLAYLYLPKHFPGPHQVIHLVPAGDVTQGHRTLPQSIEADYASFVRSGRAVFAVVLPGYLERDRLPGWKQPDPASEQCVAEAARDIVDLRRGLDYLETHPDVDQRKVAVLEASVGGIVMALPAIDTRYRALILQGAGLDRWWVTHIHKQANPIHFVPLIRVPTLLVHGQYDEMTPWKTKFQPLYNLIPEPKTLYPYDGGHRPDHEDLVPAVNKFLDKEFGAPGS